MPYFVVHTLDAPGKAEARAANRPAHRARLRQHDHPVSVRIGGPLLDGTGEMCGTMLVIEASVCADVETYLAGDPYALAGIYKQVSIHGYNWGLGQPEMQDG
ncbi:YciI family protein [Ruegeria sp. HKCCD8929]|uniref:YciI family protein n=1 Tax=Ruegeria sp. HKCCD8929 TaxID=2683006 RepID=UPI0014887F21|nr:YciI family protein [Ruegeria sp. HKCCD8929]